MLKIFIMKFLCKIAKKTLFFRSIFSLFFIKMSHTSKQPSVAMLYFLILDKTLTQNRQEFFE